MAPTRSQTTQNVTALVTGLIRDPHTPVVDNHLGHVVEDLKAADPEDVLTAFCGLTLGMIHRLADARGDTPETLWQSIATAFIAHQEVSHHG